MRLVFVNYSHPATPHVSAMRGRGMAEALARRGHRVVLVTRSLHLDDVPVAPDVVAAELDRHNWGIPYHLPVVPVPRPGLKRLRDPGTPRPVRQALIAAHYLWGTGLNPDWSDASRPYWPILGGFQPDLIWGIFGSVDSWVIARGIAEVSGATWMMDVKDSWEVFIHPLLRRAVARRFRDAGAITSNSALLAQQFAKWFPHSAEVVYSGVDEEWLQSAEAPPKDFRIMLVGGIYNEANLTAFVQTLGRWLSHLGVDAARNVSLVYAGADGAKVERALTPFRNMWRTEIHGYLPLPKLAEICRGAAVNAYMWLPLGFHHKLVELLCCGRPIVSFPGEHPESIALANRVEGELHVCRDESQLAEAFDQVWRARNALPKPPTATASLTWDAQATRLEAAFKRTLAKNPA